MEAARTLRQQQANDTWARIFQVAVKLFARRGYHATTVDQIAREAGVAKGTFFLHFTTKDAVVTELVRLQTRAALGVRAQACGTPVDRLRATVMTLGEQAGMSREVSRAVLQAGLSNPQVGGETSALFDAVFAEMIGDARAAQSAHLLAADPDAETIASALMASYLGAALHFTTNTATPPLVSVLGPLVEANLNGFRNPRSRKKATHVAPRPRSLRNLPYPP